MKSIEREVARHSIDGNFEEKSRLNLNDLLERRKKEKKLDKKTNLMILSGVSTVAAVIFVILYI
tara:strand:- start:6187 stop:6378 length:192 start_codon:yes stop_codon:yes gene_type:complete